MHAPADPRSDPGDPEVSGRPAPPAWVRRRLGELLVEEGLITPAQLEAALALQAALTPHLRLGEILVEQELLTRETLARALRRALFGDAGPRPRLGQLLVEAGLLDPARLEAALRYQQRTGLRLGEALLQLDLLPEPHVREALAGQLGVAFVPPDAVEVDPAAVRLVGRKYALHHRVVPLRRVGDTLTVLAADPTTPALVRELEASTGCRIRLAATTRAGFQRAARLAYGEGD
jgi:type IV pilus assembly protein PilB